MASAFAPTHVNLKSRGETHVEDGAHFSGIHDSIPELQATRRNQLLTDRPHRTMEKVGASSLVLAFLDGNDQPRRAHRLYRSGLVYENFVVDRRL